MLFAVSGLRAAICALSMSVIAMLHQLSLGVPAIPTAFINPPDIP
jgi:hypothetical protein